MSGNDRMARASRPSVRWRTRVTQTTNLAIALALAAACGTSAERSHEPIGQSSSSVIGNDGAITITAPNTVLNTYAALAQDAPVGATSVLVSNAAGLDSPISQLGALAPGDLLMIVQMQGAQIANLDDPAYGAIVDLAGAGHYELVAVSAIQGNLIQLDASCGGLRRAYAANGKTQVVRVPELTQLTVQAGASLTAPPWDGSTGGVVAVHVQGNARVDGEIDVSGRGFRGGRVDNSTSNDQTTYVSMSAAAGAEKGESIAGDWATYDTIGGRYGRGAPANAGGGGNGHNAGGGGGANGASGALWTGQGIMNAGALGAAAWALDPTTIAASGTLAQSSGGGRGGYTWSANDADALTAGPANAAWGGDNRREHGGLGGRPIESSRTGRLFAGGGGGAGDSNNGAGGAGGAGGGIVLLTAQSVDGTGMLKANGATGGATAPGHNDAPGGGGGGGSLIVAADSLAGVSLEASGGAGGNQTIGSNEAEGPGGGGGGGFIAVGGGLVTRTASGGMSGTTTSPSLAEFPVNGATDGAPGQPSATITRAALPVCHSSGISVSITDGLLSTAPGSLITYVLEVRTGGPNPVSNLRVIDTMPQELEAISWTCTPSVGSTCNASAGSGSIDTTLQLFAFGRATFEIKALVRRDAKGAILNTARVVLPDGISDPSLADNIARDTTVITETAIGTLDSDGDGLPDDLERVIGTNPNDEDSDDDGVPDGAEPGFAVDTDGDGLINALDPDSDDDGLFDGTEMGLGCGLSGTDVTRVHCIADADGGKTVTDPLLRDTDGGGASDGSEDINGNGTADNGETNPAAGSAADDSLVVDTDGDGLSDGFEVRIGTNPRDADSDDDGLVDGAEPNPSIDSDGDGRINPLDEDSDGDGIFDGTERGWACDGAATDTTRGVCRTDADFGRTTTGVLSADSDRGGVPDGVEDTNRNGRVDPGERDPNDPRDDRGGCRVDADCGGQVSGQICSGGYCAPGCRGVGGNHCPAGQTCTSQTQSDGQCVAAVQPDAGALTLPDDGRLEGGGITCAVSRPGARTRADGFAAFFLGGLALTLARRRRRR